MCGRLATTAAFDRIVQVFASAPVSNPDGSTGIRLHLDGGSAAGTAYNLGGGNQVPYDSNLQPAEAQTDAIKNANFAPARKAVFHYKPNYLSVMNYFFQFDGVPRTSGSSWFSYSSFAPPALNEASLRESVGLNTSTASTWRTKWKCPNGTTRTSAAANGGIDWNCDGDTADTTAADVNDDNFTRTLTAQNNWASIRFGGGDVGGGSQQAKTSTPAEELREMTQQEYNNLMTTTR